MIGRALGLDPLDDGLHRLAYFIRRRQLETEQAKILAAELERVNGNGNGRPPPGSLPGDPAALRGIPCFARGSAGGAIRGSRPEVDALENLERRR
jgi:hypothetical protein